MVSWQNPIPGSLLDTHLMTEGMLKPVVVAEMCEAHLFI